MKTNLPKKNFPEIPRSILGLIVTGWARGGTSLVSDLIRKSSKLCGPPEFGCLLQSSPKYGLPEPYLSNLKKFWRLPFHFDNGYRNCSNFAELYDYIRQFCPNINRRHNPFIDKLPAYLPSLVRVVERAPKTPICVVVRNPLKIIHSCLGFGTSSMDAIHLFLIGTAGLVKLARTYPNIQNVYILNLEDLVDNPEFWINDLQEYFQFHKGRYDPYDRYGSISARNVRTVGVDRFREDASIAKSKAMDRKFLIEKLSLYVPFYEEFVTLKSGPFLASSDLIARWNVGDRTDWCEDLFSTA